MQKLPYGISDFRKIQRENYYYVDRTNYIEILEKLGDQYIIFLRPRRFGKSLFITTLRHYYGRQYKDHFKEIFGTSYIGKNPTPLANQYMILDMHFSGIVTDTPAHTLRGFLMEVKTKVRALLSNNTKWFDEKDVNGLEECKFPNEVLKYFFGIMNLKNIPQKIYVLIDEYDHFANDLIAFDFEEFKNAVTKNGWVRKFYEELKEGTKNGFVDRIFMTGVSAITLDSMTSGFNIGTNFSTDERLNELMGFTEVEVTSILSAIGVEEEALPTVLTDLRNWYNGYRFNHSVEQKIYNPGMVLYFAKFYSRYQKYPDDLLDVNIASDYSKVRNMFKVAGKEQENIAHLKELLEEGEISANLNRSFSFEIGWTKDDLVSLLFYNGILTIHSYDLGETIFKIPNFVIRQLYFQYFNQLVLVESHLKGREVSIREKVKALATQNDTQPILDLVRDIISQMGREDKAHFNETALKAIFASLFYVVGYYNIFSELEVRKSSTQKGRVDLLLTRRAPFEPTYQFLFELKYLRSSQEKQLTTVKKEAIQQLKDYLEYDDNLKKLENLKAYVLIFVVQKAILIEVQ